MIDGSEKYYNPYIHFFSEKIGILLLSALIVKISFFLKILEEIDL